MKYTAAHWGVYEVDADATVRAFREDPDPSPIGLHQLAPELQAMRVRRPAVRRSVLENGPGAGPDRRGKEPFVEVDWDTALDLAAGAIDRVRKSHGNGAIFGGSYGWSSAGRFHHAQGQVHRFLNAAGGYVSHRDSYSLGAGRVVMPHVVDELNTLFNSHTSWDVLAQHCEVFVCFGGVPAKNAQIGQGLVGRHRIPGGLAGLAKAGVEVINISPVADNIDTGAAVDWLPLRPNTDVALMLALAHEIRTQGWHDTAFLHSHCTGWPVFEGYLTGAADGTPKDADWAAPICGVAADRIRDLARRMAGRRVTVNCAWSLQRAEHGEQAFWMTVTLAAMLGQIGLPGGGFALGYGPTNLMGSGEADLSAAALPQGQNAVTDFIPVARIADALLTPGGSYTYDGEARRYPDIRLVYWAGGNPFHHHQDLTRLDRAWTRPETVIVNEQYWTATARRADIVFPATTTAEREDIGFTRREGVYLRMRAVTPPVGEARDDYAIFAALAERLGCAETFTEGRSAEDWLRHMHDRNRQSFAAEGIDLPTFDEMAEEGRGLVSFFDRAAPVVMLEGFRADPVAHPLPTPSGRIEIFSQAIAAMELPDCAGHPTWFDRQEWLGGERAARFPLHMISDQPVRRLHSQLDPSPWSRAGKIGGREPVHVSPADAAARGLIDGETVELFNDRGRCLAGLVVNEALRPGVVRLSTGAWYDPDPETGVERHGNPNALTRDRGASGLSQGCTAQSCLVELRRAPADAPAPRAFELPEFG